MNKEGEQLASPTKVELLEQSFQGFPVSDGIAIGVPFFVPFAGSPDAIPEFPIAIGEVDQEIDRYRKALYSSREDLKSLQQELAREGASDAVSIFETHIQMLEDPLMTTFIEEKIRERLKNTESVFHSFIVNLETAFSVEGSGFSRERFGDVRDLSSRVLSNLVTKPATFPHIHFPFQQSIIFSEEIVPSDTAFKGAGQILGFVTWEGGGNSHAALLARAKGLPFVSRIPVEKLRQETISRVIIDGTKGELIVNPSQETVSRYQILQQEYARVEQEEDKDAAPITQDGYKVELYGNINQIEDIDFLNHYSHSGVGLFRSEYPMLQKSSLLLEEEEQFLLYCKMAEKLDKKPFTIRVLDIGGDKYPELFKHLSKESHPFLGCRGIRFLLHYPEIFTIQLRAILRASALYPEIRIVYPLISDVKELREVNAFLEKTKQDLVQEGKPFNTRLEIGCMLEVPSAILTCDALITECDFFEIGTNDLIQYTMGMDRSSSQMHQYQYPAHPSLLRMIKMVILEAKKKEKPVIVCGEMAASSRFVALLLGLGVKKLSCPARFIPSIKKAIRKTHLVEAWRMADKVLTLQTAAEVLQFLQNHSMD